jgi:hypothetical protein
MDGDLVTLALLAALAAFVGRTIAFRRRTGRWR